MPTSFHFFRIVRFPPGSRFETTEQLSLLADDEQNQEAASTTVTLTSDKFLDGAARYFVNHDFLVHLSSPGRARHMTFREYVTQYDFPSYRTHGGERFPCLVVRTKVKVAGDLVDRLNKKMNGAFEAEPLAVDFAKLRPLVTNIGGAWFGEMKAANINTTGLFGPHVDKSKEFKHAEDIGKLNALLLSYPYRDQGYMVMVTRNGGLVLYDNFDAEESPLAVALDIRDKLLDRAWADPKAEKGKGRGQGRA